MIVAAEQTVPDVAAVASGPVRVSTFSEVVPALAAPATSPVNMDNSIVQISKAKSAKRLPSLLARKWHVKGSNCTITVCLVLINVYTNRAM
jgi:hypothetical protein